MDGKKEMEQQPELTIENCLHELIPMAGSICVRARAPKALHINIIIISVYLIEQRSKFEWRLASVRHLIARLNSAVFANTSTHTHRYADVTTF